MRLAPPPSPEVEAEVHLAALSEGVRRAVSRLDEDERLAIVLAYFGGHSYRETAEMLGEPEGTVKSRAFYAVRNLRVILDEMGVTR